jgi:FixJ family two-component response regulator
MAFQPLMGVLNGVCRSSNVMRKMQSDSLADLVNI